MKYYPNPTFLTKASDIRQKRHTRTIVIIVVLIIITLLTLFVRSGAKMQELYAKEYPELVGAATRETTERTVRSTEETTETTEATTETSETTILAPVIVTEETTEVTEVTVQVNTPDPFVEEEPVYFYVDHSLQTVSHEQRDVMLDVMKQQVIDYINTNSNERISFRYVNLASNETMGINDLEPIVPGGAFALPIEMAYYTRVESGFIFQTSILSYMGEEAPGASSFIADTYSAGKQFYMRTLAQYAIARNDNIALHYILDRLGGVDRIWPEIAEMSSYINFTSDITYTNAQGVQVRGNGRTSCYDLGQYAASLYYAYINNPSLYQPLINDLYYSETDTAYRIAFGEDALIFHVSGRNEDTNSYTDVAIIDCDEPIVIAISAECSSYGRAYEIETILATYLAQYISSCHT